MRRHSQTFERARTCCSRQQQSICVASRVVCTDDRKTQRHNAPSLSGVCASPGRTTRPCMHLRVDAHLRICTQRCMLFMSSIHTLRVGMQGPSLMYELQTSRSCCQVAEAEKSGHALPVTNQLHPQARKLELLPSSSRQTQLHQPARL